MSVINSTSKKYEVLEKANTEKDFKMKEYYESLTTWEVFRYSLLPYIFPSFAGAYIGTSIGGPVGGVVGGSTGLLAGHYYSSNHHYDEYKKWLQLYKETEVLKEFKILNEETRVLEEFVCPITLELIKDPVKSPFGQYYERSSIQNLANVSPNGKMNCPLRNGTFTMAEVKDAPEFFSMMKAKIKSELLKEMNSNLSTEIKSGLSSLIVDLDKQITNYVVRESNVLNEQLRTSVITLDQYSKRMTDLTTRMNQ